MKLETASVAGSRIALIVGCVISAIPILMMGVGGSVMAATNPQMVEKESSNMDIQAIWPTSFWASKLAAP